MEKKMKKPIFREFLAKSVLEKKPVFLDGGMGTMIQAAQAEAKEQGIDISYSIPEELNITHGDVIKKIYRAYFEAGANVLTANTFGANPIKVASESEFSCKSLIEEGVKLLKNTIDEFLSSKENSFDDSHRVYIGWDTGQIGKLLEPMGELTFDDAYNSYKEAAIIAENAGAEVAIVETMSDLYEVKAAVLAIKENTHLPIIASMTFQSNLRTLTGADVLTCVTYLEALGVDVLGFNCGGDLAEDEELSRQFCAYAHIPVLAQPNAGLPVVEKGRSVFKVLPSTFAASQAENRKNGVSVLGGCCGTTPLHIKAMIDAVKTVNIEEKSSTKEADTYICSYNQTVQVGGKAGPMIIGERINPTGKKKCKAALRRIREGIHLLVNDDVSFEVFSKMWRKVCIEELAAVMMSLLSRQDLTDEMSKHFNLDKEMQRMHRAEEAKNDSSTFLFCGKSIYGTLIHSACKEFGWTYDYTVWGISLTNLRMLFADSVKTMYLSKEERKKAHISNDRTTVNMDNAQAAREFIRKHRFN